MLLMPFPPPVPARFALGSANAQKTKLIFHTGDGGTAHAAKGLEGILLIATPRPFPSSQHVFWLLDVLKPIAGFAWQSRAHAL
ncbi:hypothetical protein BG55_05755 [Erwinia mallotivora]|uniref:Uncharacterized protein n=1 Tax=Erwinia mallotivora TaxID=69222 RepID=A0A014MEE2_9GAMM|nr:hypothetical protein BG55_05755 [Erwinia mallotivora]